jgi:hypothetical protein
MPDTVPKQPLKKCSIQVTTNRLPKRIELGKNRSDSKNGNVNERLKQFSPMVCRAITGTDMSGETRSSSVTGSEGFLKESSNFQDISKAGCPDTPVQFVAALGLDGVCECTL